METNVLMSIQYNFKVFTFLKFKLFDPLRDYLFDYLDGISKRKFKRINEIVKNQLTEKVLLSN